MPVLAVDAMHSCFSHALLEQLVFYRHTVQNWNHTVLFFRRKSFDKYPHNKNLVNNGRYTGWIGKWIDYLISPDEVYFEHLGARIPVQDVFFPVMQPTLWADGRNYPGRPILSVPPTLEQIRPPYDSLMQYVNGISMKNESLDKDSIWLINRAAKYGRSMRMSLIHNLTKHVPSLRIITPERSNPQKQIDDMRAAKMVIFRHGSILSKLIWVRPGTIAVDMDVRADRVKIIDRLCELSGCRHVYVPYNDDNEIVKIVVSLL